jgi:hypothetical protein
MFCHSVAGRVELRTTRYHKAHDQMGRGWITIDGEEIVNMCTFKAEGKWWEESQKLRKAWGTLDYRDPAQKKGYYRAYAEAEVILRKEGIFSRSEFNRYLFEYLNMSIGEILKSDHPIVRGIGMLDRRTGKRRLATICAENEHPFVRLMYDFRCGAEGLTTASRSDREGTTE